MKPNRVAIYNPVAASVASVGFGSPCWACGEPAV
jgi:hypothetical protein